MTTKRVTLNRNGFPGYYTAADGRFEIWPADKKYLVPQCYFVRDRQAGKVTSMCGLGSVREYVAVRTKDEVA